MSILVEPFKYYFLSTIVVLLLLYYSSVTYVMYHVLFKLTTEYLVYISAEESFEENAPGEYAQKLESRSAHRTIF